MQLQTLANLAQVVGVAAVIAAIAFGIAQIRHSGSNGGTPSPSS